jgi:hypothetical protein
MTHRLVYYLKYNVSDTAFCPLLWTGLETETSSLYLLVPTELVRRDDQDSIQSSVRCVLNDRQEGE